MRGLKKEVLNSVLFSLLLIPFCSLAQNVGINSTGAEPDESALLDLSSTDKGFLITRSDTANISSPAFGLLTLAPLDSCLYVYSGTFWKSVGGVGEDCPCACSSATEPPALTFPCDGTVIPVVEVTSITGEVWMDRNLGASQVATSFSDADAYGDLYQWGRCSDGHEKRNSSTTTTLSTTDTPGHSSFIKNPYDWRDPKNDNLWQGVSGINNPCPTGYRIPTSAEFDAEKATWATASITGAFNSVLKLTAGGWRNFSSGTIENVGRGFYWSSTIDNTYSKYLLIIPTAAYPWQYFRGLGMSVRCIKD